MMDNNTGNSQDNDLGEQDSFGGFGYSIGCPLGIILILIVITYFSYVCVKSRRPGRAAAVAAAVAAADDDRISGMRLGFDEATLESFPKLLYSQAKNADGDSDSAAVSCSGCSICLADFKDADILRLLPYCGHFFHVKCVDPWLRLRPTCPICRNSPLPSPLPSPLVR